MDKNQQYYTNRNNYGNICVPVRDRILNYLIKEKFLSEFSTEEEKLQVLENLGITQRLTLLLNALGLLLLTVDEKADVSSLSNYAYKSELVKYAFKEDLYKYLTQADLEGFITENDLRTYITESELRRYVTERLGNYITQDLLGLYITEDELAGRLENLKPKDEKSKGYYSSYEELILNNPTGKVGDWAIVNVDGTWYIYKYTTSSGWTSSGVYDSSVDLNDYIKRIDLTLYVLSTLVDYVKKRDLESLINGILELSLDEYAKLSDLNSYVKSTSLEGILRNLITDYLREYQPLLESGINIKTINGKSILGEGNLEIKEGTENNTDPTDPTYTPPVCPECPNLDDYVTKDYLYNIQNPLKATMSVIPSLLEYTGETKNILITITTKKGNSNVNPDSITLSYNGITVNNANKTENVGLKDIGKYTFNATCRYNDETATCSGQATITLPTYYGFDLASAVENLNILNLNKVVQGSISMTKTLENTVYGSYLWIVSPFTVTKVAVDQNYTYPVAGSEVANRNGFHYWRSNAAIDLSKLTYYIK